MLIGKNTNTVWKFKFNSSTRTLRDIKLGQSMASKAAILSVSRKHKHQNHTYVNVIQRQQKLISRKIWVTEKCLSFQSVVATFMTLSVHEYRQWALNIIHHRHLPWSMTRLRQIRHFYPRAHQALRQPTLREQIWFHPKSLYGQVLYLLPTPVKNRKNMYFFGTVSYCF